RRCDIYEKRQDRGICGKHHRDSRAVHRWPVAYDFGHIVALLHGHSDDGRYKRDTDGQPESDDRLSGPAGAGPRGIHVGGRIWRGAVYDVFGTAQWGIVPGGAADRWYNRGG